LQRLRWQTSSAVAQQNLPVNMVTYFSLPICSRPVAKEQMQHAAEIGFCGGIKAKFLLCCFIFVREMV
jgi:hypothetical protein